MKEFIGRRIQVKRTRVSEFLGIEYTIIQGGMNWISGAELAAAVSNAGGLGVISPSAGADFADDLSVNLRNHIEKARNLTDKPFGVNLPLIVTPKEQIDLVVELNVPIVITSAGNPATYTQHLKDAGVRVLHVASSTRQAQSAEAKGVDAIIAEGVEAGGHNGPDEIPTFVLVPQVVDSVKIPVVAAGGIADSRSFVAALALGAEGVQIGTRFIATHECLGHTNFKEAVVKATDTDTAITGRKLGPSRCLKGEVIKHVLEMESRGASAEELQSFIGLERARKGQIEGDLKDGEMYCGAIAGIVKEVVSAAEVIQEIIDGVPSILDGLQ